jgi:cytoplasmic FMR1 interacting protein
MASPIYTVMQSLANVLEGKPNLAKAPQILRDLVNNSWKADKLYRPPAQNVSLFKSVLQRFQTMLGPVQAEWSGTAPDNGVMNVDSTTEFYRLWSGLQFVCSLPTGENELSILELFGDGLMWAGCTIIYFLGQQHRFEVFDFSYHILNVEESAVVPCTNAVRSKL